MAASCSSSSSGQCQRSRGTAGKEEGDLLRTVDCLRGRLQAERVASRVAREDSDLMAKRVAELERLMAAEIRARDRAEKMLKCALKKLQSLVPPGLSRVSGSALGDSSSDSASCREVAGKQERRSAYSTAGSALQSLSPETSWSSAGSADSDAGDDPRLREHVESKALMDGDGELTSDDSTRQPSIGSEGKDHSTHEIDGADASPGSVSSSFRKDTEDHRPITSKSRVGETQTEVERKVDGKWQLGGNADDVLVS